MQAKQFFFVLVAGIILSSGAIIFAFSWGTSQLETNSADVSSLLAERDAQRENIITLQQADQESDKLEDVNALLDRLLPKEKNQETLILDIIYTATAEAGIPFSQVGSFAFSGGGDPDALSGTEPIADLQNVLAYPFNIQIADISYETLLKLLREIETNGRIIQVATIQIAPSKDVPGTISAVTLQMEAYVKP